MEFATYRPAMLPLLLEHRIFADEPFFIADVGCSGNIDQLWRLFGDQLAAVGFDPKENEIARLNSNERNPKVKFVAARIGLRDDHEFHARRRSQQKPSNRYFDPLGRSSAAVIWNKTRIKSSSGTVNDPTPKFGIADYVRANGLKRIDFVKIDTDGADLEVVLSSVDIIRSCQILGYMIECQFSGSNDDTQNSFHNIDRVMREHGFVLYNLGLRRYSRAALPAPFVLDIPAQTESGQLHWADAIFLRDGASPQYDLIWGQKLPVVSALKLAALYELFSMPDCAAELIAARQADIAPLVDPKLLLNALTPRLRGRKISYRDYVAAFDRDPALFFPTPPELLSPTSIDRLIGLLRKVYRKMGNVLGVQ